VFRTTFRSKILLIMLQRWQKRRQ